jgi:hypothetical protein
MKYTVEEVRAMAGVTDAMVELAVRAHDREEAGQKGEPDPWEEEFPEPYRSERMTAMRLAITAALAAQGQGDRDAYEGARHDLLDWKRRALSAESVLRSLGYRGIIPTEAPASPAGVPDGNTLPIDIRGKLHDVPIPVHLHIIALRDRLEQLDACETLVSVYDAVSRSNLTRDVKTPETKTRIVREALAAAPSAPEGGAHE